MAHRGAVLAGAALLVTTLACDPRTPPQEGEPTDTSTAPQTSAPATAAPLPGPPGTGPPAVPVVDERRIGTPVLIEATAGGGQVDDAPRALASATDRRRFVAEVADHLADRITTAVEGLGDADAGQPWGATVHIGCLPPTRVAVIAAATGERLRVTLDRRERTVLCLAAVTYVVVWLRASESTTGE